MDAMLTALRPSSLGNVSSLSRSSCSWPPQGTAPTVHPRPGRAAPRSHNRPQTQARTGRFSKPPSPDGRSFELSEKGVYVSNIPKGEEDVPYTVLQDDSEQLTAIYNVKRVPRLILINNG